MRVAEEPVVHALLAATRFVDIAAVRENHVVDPLESVARDFGFAAHHVEVLLECSFPVLAAELLQVLAFADQGKDPPSAVHVITPLRLIVVCEARAAAIRIDGWQFERRVMRPRPGCCGSSFSVPFSANELFVWLGADRRRAVCRGLSRKCSKPAAPESAQGASQHGALSGSGQHREPKSASTRTASGPACSSAERLRELGKEHEGYGDPGAASVRHSVFREGSCVISALQIKVRVRAPF